MGRPSKREIEKLSSEIADLDRQRRQASSSVHEFSLTEAEQRFVEVADARGKKLFRAGWPDFLCVDSDGSACFVEVKYNDDEVRPSQVRMFAALERHLGLRVMVWDPRWPSRLTPWRTYQEERAERLAALGDGPRQHRLRRMQSGDPDR